MIKIIFLCEYFVNSEWIKAVKGHSVYNSGKNSQVWHFGQSCIRSNPLPCGTRFSNDANNHAVLNRQQRVNKHLSVRHHCNVTRTCYKYPISQDVRRKPSKQPRQSHCFTAKKPISGICTLIGFFRLNLVGLY